MSKLSPEEELEKQYRDYKAQYESWKEKNKNSTDSDAYKAYVKQFEEWEKDVEKRRRIIREKAEQETENERLRLQREEDERAELERQQKEAEAQAQAQAYLESQQSYLNHHVAALEAEQQQQQAPLPVHQPAPSSYHPPIHDASNDRLNADVVMREMMDIVMGGAAAALGGDRAVLPSQAPPQPTLLGGAHGPPQQVWGNIKAPYDKADHMWMRWGGRAAPPHVWPPPSENHSNVPTPCWLLLEETQKRKMMIAPPAPPPSQAPPIHVIPPPIFT